MSMFDYCCPVWANVSNPELSNVKNIQKRAARIILKDQMVTHPCPSLMTLNGCRLITD